MSKPTPGPWEWFTGKSDPYKQQCMKHFKGSDGQGFAYTIGLSIEKDIANANLIVAAPELLALAESTLGVIEILGSNCPELLSMCEAEYIQAIARAKGETDGTPTGQDN